MENPGSHYHYCTEHLSMFPFDFTLKSVHYQQQNGPTPLSVELEGDFTPELRLSWIWQKSGALRPRLAKRCHVLTGLGMKVWAGDLVTMRARIIK